MLVGRLMMTRLKPKYAIGDILAVEPFGLCPTHHGQVIKRQWRGQPFNQWSYEAEWWLDPFNGTIMRGQFLEHSVRLDSSVCPCAYEKDQFDVCMRTGGCGV